ncbi:tropomyosin-like [Gossypium hirsutum]|uniref:Tropomyosin-like n=1 Tax=Gossypium hirsutum TaxID=3635 RepID=A0A1U8PMG4_GOSHI|nr:tropomyosin-like [Gossypium hirsutum]
MKRLAVSSMVTPEYNGWFRKRDNDNIPKPSLEDTRPMEEQLQVAPSELEIIKQDFEKKSSVLGKRIEQLEEEKMHMKLDVEVQKFQEAQAQNEVLEKSFLESKNEQDELRGRVEELERSLCLYRNCNSMMELRASLSKFEEMKGKIEELEMVLQSCEMRIEFLEANEEQWKGQLHHSQDQVRSRDYIMGEAVTQIQEVADYLQSLAVQADVLSVKYELESNRG